MATGTGLPTPNSGGPVLAQAAGGVSGDSLFNAQSWSQIASAGEQLAKAGGDYLKVAEHKVQVGALSDQDVEIQRKQIELRNTHADDPQAFDAAWTGYTEGKLSEVAPWMVNHVKATLGSNGNTAYSAILNSTRVQAEKSAETSWGALHDMAAQDVQSAAMAGTLNTPEGQLKVEKYRQVLKTGVSSQFIVPEVAEQRGATLESTATVYAARAGIQTTFNADGPIAAVKQIDDLTRDENLKLSPEQRLTLGSRLRADVHAWDAERTHNLSTVDLESASLLKAKQGGIPIDQSRIDDVVERYKRFGGQAQAASFLADVQHSDDLSFLSRVPPAEAAAWVNEYKTSRGFSTAVNTAIPAEGRALLDRIAGPESGGRYDVRYGGQRFQNFADHPRVAEPITSGPDVGKTSSAAGRYQFIGSTWDDQAKKLGLTNFSPANQDAAAWNLAQEEYKAKTGKDLLAVLRSDDAAAKADVPRQLSGQWSSLPGGRQPAGAAAPTSTPSDTTFIGKANTLVAKRVSDDADTIIAGMNDKASPVLPTEQRINDLLTAASATNTPEVLQKVSQAAAEYQFRRQFGRAPEPQESAIVSELQRKAVTEGLSTTDARRLEIATETRDRTAKALQDDPLNHTVGALADTSSIPPPAPLDIANPVAFRAGLQTRAQWAATGTRTFETAPMPALTTAEATQVRAALDAADPAGKARIYSDIVASTSGGTRTATLAKLGGKGVDGMVESFAGAITGLDPAIGESIIRGQGALKLKDAYNPMKDGNKENSNAAIDKYFPAGAFSLAARTDPQGAYAVMRGAIVARVADLAATDPNFDGKFTDAQFQRATNDVTGGIVTHNGGNLIAPVRGMNQRGFDAKIAGVTDADLQGVMTQNGTPITAAYLQGDAQLESLSDGRYLVRLGKDPERPIYAFRDVGANVPNRLRPFVLDLRNIAPSTTQFDPLALSNALP